MHILSYICMFFIVHGSTFHAAEIQKKETNDCSTKAYGDDDSMGSTVPTLFEQQDWSNKLVEAYTVLAKKISKSCENERITPETWGSPCKDAHDAFASLLDTLENCFVDKKKRTALVHEFAQELQAITDTKKPDTLVQWLCKKHLTITMHAAGTCMSLPATAFYN